MGDALEALAATARLVGLALDPQQISKLDAFGQLLLRWNNTYSLTSIRDRDQALVVHISDCLAVVAPLRAQRQGPRLLDVGSGGGLPGVVLAIAAPELDVTCIDAVAKKVAFVQHAASTLELTNVRAIHGRVEALRNAAPFDVIASRAFASLPQFTALTRHLLKPGGVWLAMKGVTPQSELDQLDGAIEVFHVEHIAVPKLDAARCLIWMRPRAEVTAN